MTKLYQKQQENARGKVEKCRKVLTYRRGSTIMVVGSQWAKGGHYVFALCFFMYHKRRKTMEMTKEERLLKFIFVDGEVDFYEEHLMGLTDEEIQRFFNENPDYMAGLPVNDISLLRDKMWRGILKKIERHNVQDIAE